MMTRRTFLCGLTLGTPSAPLAAEAQQRAAMPRVGVLRLDSPSAHSYAEFLRGLHELGYIDGRNIALEVRWAEDRLERLPALATELVHLKVDVIVTHGIPGIRAARDASGTIPIVMGRMGRCALCAHESHSHARPQANH